MAAASAHRFQQRCTIGTIERVLRIGRRTCDGWNVDVCRCNTTVLTAFEVIEKTGRGCQFCSSKRQLEDILIHVSTRKWYSVQLAWSRDERSEPEGAADGESANESYDPSSGMWSGFVKPTASG